MKRYQFSTALVVFLAGSANAAEFRSLFDGTSLHGWKALDMSYWSVRDGAITGQSTAEHPCRSNQFIVWQGGEVADFELKLKFRATGNGGNSGVQFRSVIRPDGLAVGYQADIYQSGPYLGGVCDELHTRQGPELLTANGTKTVINASGHREVTELGEACTIKPAGEWNDYHITARGHHIILRINGVKCSELIDQEEGHFDLQGMLGLQLRSGEPMTVQFKDILLKTLPRWGHEPAPRGIQTPISEPPEYVAPRPGCEQRTGVRRVKSVPPGRLLHRLPAATSWRDIAALRCSRNVGIVQVDDYVCGGYAGEFPAPPHADHNPRKAFVVYWRNFDYRFVFSHEASYVPWFEFPSGTAICYQMFEGNEGWAELFNQEGRRERNSFVDVIEAEPERVWVRWTYFGVNMESGDPAYRAVEDFWAFPNGLVLRRQIYHTLRPNDHRGYAREPIELIPIAPAGRCWYDILMPADAPNEYRAFTGLDAFSLARVDILWRRSEDLDALRRFVYTAEPPAASLRLFGGETRRAGCAWKTFDDARGVAAITPLREGTPFLVVGDASGFPWEYTRWKEHSDPGTGGWNWGTETWDHWPVGWLNSQGHQITPASLRQFPNHAAAVGLDLWSLPNEETEARAFFSLMGVGDRDVEPIRRLARQWLEKGPDAVADPATTATLQWSQGGATLHKFPTSRPESTP